MIDTPGGVDAPAADEHLVLVERREAGGGLVEQQHARVGHEGPPHGHHLALAARQRPGPLLAALAEHREELGDDLEALAEAAPAPVVPHLEVLLDREAGEHVVVLRDVADAPVDELVGLEAGDVRAVEGDLAGPHGDEPEHGLQEGRLAGAVRADDADQLLAGDVDGAAVEDVDLGHVAGDQVGGLDDVLARRVRWARRRSAGTSVRSGVGRRLRCRLVGGVHPALLSSDSMASMASSTSASTASSSSTLSGASWCVPR